MLEPSVLIEMQITCNYQPENCSNTMNYFEVRFFFFFPTTSSSLFSFGLFCMGFSRSGNSLYVMTLPGFDGKAEAVICVPPPGVPLVFRCCKWSNLGASCSL